MKAGQEREQRLEGVGVLVLEETVAPGRWKVREEEEELEPLECEQPTCERL